MSDTGRQSLTDKAGAALKPDSEKTYLEQAGDTIKGKSDSAASSAQPQSQKSFTQEIGDAVSGNQNENQSSIADKAKDALGINKQ
ncbi:hypothetical protein I203_103206 [Kwoniella mangroviensis CBS 8507]|uniref:uncharacterized protein n=1 Tax=Kwoniella mangroviensis CBS 8507 TaxID=1296122 RepID=UPI00080D31DB|nr:uncharacterized protein I203_07420 [Kwoniella mangroviensis CBS 8507]OCF63356.1 hypothetical protein I203_07420 [Kwoniella mangroviensis CBS 8507]